MTAGLLALVAVGVERRITWYLAVDQYGYLTFAHDLARGRVFHHWPPLDALAAAIPARTDVLVQTYVYDQGRLYCRYAPGFPMLLAGWLTLFGEDGAHSLNPAIYLLLLGLLLAFQQRLLGCRWRATAGVTLVVLFPTLLHLWALTPTRDLATHLAGFLGLFLLLPVHARPLAPGRAASAGIALGFAGSVRPDAVLYLLPALLLAVARWSRDRTRPGAVARGLGAGALGVALGLAPSLAYYWAATGNPLLPTQGMEIGPLTSPSTPAGPDPALPTEGRVGYPPGAWRGGTTSAVQGGGLRLEHLWSTLPGNVNLLRQSYGDLFLLLALVGSAIAIARRRLLFLATVPYGGIALLFFSFWGRPDARYLIGVHLLLPMLVVEGTLGVLDLVRYLARRRLRRTARAVAVATGAAFLVGAAAIAPPTGFPAPPALRLVVPGIAGVALLAAAAWPARRLVQLAAPLMAFALVGLLASRTIAAPQSRASFQRPEMVRARETFAQVVDRGAVVITTEDVGRPAENIDYYSGVAHALYLTDLERWRLPLGDAAHRFLQAGMRPYVFLPAHDTRLPALIAELRPRFRVDLVADIPPERAKDHFVAAPFHRGVRMVLYEIARPEDVGG